jgi:hypothetical protein
MKQNMPASYLRYMSNHLTSLPACPDGVDIITCQQEVCSFVMFGNLFACQPCTLCFSLLQMVEHTGGQVHGCSCQC